MAFLISEKSVVGKVASGRRGFRFCFAALRSVFQAAISNPFHLAADWQGVKIAKAHHQFLDSCQGTAGCWLGAHSPQFPVHKWYPLLKKKNHPPAAHPRTIHNTPVLKLVGNCAL